MLGIPNKLFKPLPHERLGNMQPMLYVAPNGSSLLSFFQFQLRIVACVMLLHKIIGGVYNTMPAFTDTFHVNSLVVYCYSILGALSVCNACRIIAIIACKLQHSLIRACTNCICMIINFILTDDATFTSIPGMFVTVAVSFGTGSCTTVA
jgi:hypothetical protein